jgi:hypothetical protein
VDHHNNHVAHPDLRAPPVNPVNQANLVNPAVPDNLVELVNQLAAHNKASDANLAHLDLLAPLDPTVNPETLVPTETQDNLDKLLAKDHPAQPDLPETPELPDNLVNPEVPDNLETTDNAELAAQDPKDLLATPELPETPVVPDNPEALANPATKAHLDHKATPAALVEMVNPDTPEAKVFPDPMLPTALAHHVRWLWPLLLFLVVNKAKEATVAVSSRPKLDFLQFFHIFRKFFNYHLSSFL